MGCAATRGWKSNPARQELVALVREQILPTADDMAFLSPSKTVARCDWAGVSKQSHLRRIHIRIEVEKLYVGSSVHNV